MIFYLTICCGTVQRKWGKSVSGVCFVVLFLITSL